MAGDAPLLERLAKLPALPAAEALGLLERLPQPQTDPVIGPLFGVDEDGDAAVNPLVPAGLKQFEDRTELTCYAALIEGLTRDLYPAFGDLGKKVFADGAISKKHKELTALAVAVSQNCFD